MSHRTVAQEPSGPVTDSARHPRPDCSTRLRGTSTSARQRVAEGIEHPPSDAHALYITSAEDFGNQCTELRKLTLDVRTTIGPKPQFGTVSAFAAGTVTTTGAALWVCSAYNYATSMSVLNVSIVATRVNTLTR